MSKILFINNPTAGLYAQEIVAQACDAFVQAGHTVENAVTIDKGDGARFTLEARYQNTPILVVAGGGGTVSEVINALMHRDDYDKFTLGIIPCGALNVLALEMGIDHPATAIAAICAGKVQKITLGQVKTPEGDRLFSVMASAGVDSWTVKNLHLKLKRCVGKFAFFVTFARVLMSRSAPLCKAVINDKTYEGDLICACNGRYYGGPFRYTDVSDLQEDEFEVVILKKITVFSLMRHIFSITAKYFLPEQNSTVLKAKSMTITADEPYPLQIDGDIINTLPAEVSIFHRRLSLLTSLRIPKNK